MSKLNIKAIRNPAPERNYSLMHKPIVSLDKGIPQQKECLTSELLTCLRRVGFSEQEVERGQQEIVARGETIFESTEISISELENALQCCEREPSVSLT